MSNEVNFSKMYQFIASFNQGEQTWVDTADTNDNGIVSKAEFKKFVNENFAEWNGEEGGMPDADLINKFWSSLDTTKGGKTNRVANTNNLHANEIEAMNRKLDAYVTLGTFVEQNVKAPDFINNQAGWLRDVESDLSAIVENLIKSGNIDDLETELTNALPQVQNKVTAEYVVFEYQESLKDSLNDYPDYNISEDETLNKIISNYLLNLEGTEEPEDIETDIKDIIDAYLATAGLKENNNYSLDELSENEGNALNPLQKEVIKKGLKEANTNNMDELLTQVFGDISLDETTKQEFITMLNEILDSAVDAFVETLTVADIQEGQPITTSKAFDAQAYITSEMKAPIVEKHYLGKASEVIDKFADELVNGIKDNSATLNVYNASKGEIKLDKASARALIVELDSAAKEFVKLILTLMLI